MKYSAVSLLLAGTLAQAAAVGPWGSQAFTYSFEENHGQTDPSALYITRGPNYTLFLTRNGAVATLNRPGAPIRSIRMSLAGARTGPAIEPLDGVRQISSYFTGRHSRNWVRDVPSYSRVRYRSVYDGIDMVYHSAADQLEYDFVVEPGASPEKIAMTFEGADSVRVNRSGEMELSMGNNRLVHRRPIAYQDIAGARHQVAASYELSRGRVQFRIGEYDHSRPLVIDPVMVYSTYLGGDRNDRILAVAVDKGGNTYVAGETASPNFPQVGSSPSQMKYALNYGFISKINAAGNQILYSVYLGGASATSISSIAVDNDGNVYVGGTTGAVDFPLANPVQASKVGPNIGFVTKLGPAGDQVLFSTYLGGERNDSLNALALDASGNIYVAGSANSSQFPVVNAMQSQTGGNGDVFVAKYSAPNYRLAYSTYLGGTGWDQAFGLTADGQGNAYVVGSTYSPAFATKNAYQTKLGGGTDAFVARINAGGSLGFFTYLGGTGEDEARAVAVDGAGRVWVTGAAAGGTGFPIAGNAVQKDRKGNVDAFVTALDNTGTQLLYSTLLGGTATGATWGEEGFGIAVDRDGIVTATGVTNSSDFPSVRPLQPFSGVQDAFVAALDPKSGALVYSTALGGTNVDIAHAIAVDAMGAVYVGGETQSTNFPLKQAVRGSYVGGNDAFLSKICDPRISVQPADLTFTYIPGGQLPPAQTVNVSACTAIPFAASSDASFTRVSPNSGMTNGVLQVSVDPASLAPGDHPATISITAADAVNSPVSIPVVVRVAPPAPVISAAGIVNGATAKGGAVAPGELIVIYGSNMGPVQLAGAALDGDVSLAKQVQGTRVLFDGAAAPIIYTSAGQLSAVVPYSVANRTSTTVQVEYQGVRSNAVSMPVTASSPGIFTANSSGSGQGSILNQDGSVNGVSLPAEKGSIIAIYATGEGQTDPGGVDGLLALTAYPKPVLPVRVTVDDHVAEVMYAGAAPGMVAGVMQLNIRIPESVRSGELPLVVSVGSGNSAASVTVAVK